ncbi:hypothetical protein [Vibrio maritimus]|uniref:hypothetical protein n=1 Tax=Vibrio maritimus TaxID=990268 RepID=UPI003AF1EDD4
MVLHYSNELGQPQRYAARAGGGGLSKSLAIYRWFIELAPLLRKKMRRYQMLSLVHHFPQLARFPNKLMESWGM